MSRDNFILDLVVKAAPYRDIFSGIKPEEYRADKPEKILWANRILSSCAWKDCEGSEFPRFRIMADVILLNPSPHDFHPYCTARISLGYASDRPSHLRKIRGIRWGAPNPAWCYGIVTAEKCFIIELGEML